MKPLAPTPRPATRPMLGLALRAGSVLAFSVMAASVKLASDAGVHPVETIFYRFLFGFLPLGLWLALGPGWGAIRTSRPAAHLWRAGVGLLSMVVNFSAIALLPLAEATAFSFAAPLVATALSALFLGEAVGRHRWGAVLLGFVGVLIVTRPGGASLPAEGVLLGLLSPLGIAAANVTVRHISRTEPAEAIVFWFGVNATVLTGLALPLVGSAHDVATWGILLLCGVSGGIGQLCMSASLRAAPLSLVGPIDYLAIGLAILFGWLIWSEVPAPHTWVGAAVVSASGLYVVHRERRLGKMP